MKRSVKIFGISLFSVLALVYGVVQGSYTFSGPSEEYGNMIFTESSWETYTNWPLGQTTFRKFYVNSAAPDYMRAMIERTFALNDQILVDRFFWKKRITVSQTDASVRVIEKYFWEDGFNHL